MQSKSRERGEAHKAAKQIREDDIASSGVELAARVMPRLLAAQAAWKDKLALTIDDATNVSPQARSMRIFPQIRISASAQTHVGYSFEAFSPGYVGVNHLTGPNKGNTAQKFNSGKIFPAFPPRMSCPIGSTFMRSLAKPLLRGGRDYALLAPVTSYEGEGLYVIDVGPGTDLFRVSPTFDGKGGLHLSRENPRYGGHDITRQDFEERVMGIARSAEPCRQDDLDAVLVGYRGRACTDQLVIKNQSIRRRQGHTHLERRRDTAV